MRGILIKSSSNVKTKLLSIFHLNIRSLNSKLRDFCIFVDQIEVNFDVLVLSEVWSNNIDFYQNILDEYILHTDLPADTSIGGIAIFVNKSLPCKLRTDLYLKSTPIQKIEKTYGLKSQRIKPSTL